MNGLENPEIHSIGIPLAETSLQGPNRSDHSDDESESISFSSHTVKNYEPGDLKSLLTVTDTERSAQDNGQTGSSTGNTPEQSSPKPGLIDQKRKGHGRSVPTKRIDRLCRQMARASKNVSPSRNKRRSSALGLGSEAKRQVKRSRDPFYDEILEQYEPRLYEVLPLPHHQAAGPRFRPTKTATGNKHEPLWMFPKVIKFDVCRPYQHASADLYVVNQSSEPVPFQLSILGDPRLNREFSPSAMIPRVPTHTEILQEKPYFQQANMHFDSAIYTVGPVLGLEKLPLREAWLRSYGTHRNADNFAGLSMIPLDLTFSAASTKNPSEIQKFQQAISSFFSVRPSSGLLNPLETARIGVQFHPWFVTSAHAQLMIATTNESFIKSIYLIGACARQNVEITPGFLDLGRTPYDTMQQRKVYIKNHGRYPVKFEVSAAELITKQNLLHPGFDTVYVNYVNGVVQPYGEFVVTVFYLPGKPGKFLKAFQVQMENEFVTVVKIRGKGVFDNVLLDLPRKLPKRRGAAKSGGRLEGESQKENEDLDEAAAEKWAMVSQRKAFASNIQRKPHLTTGDPYRPFEGILEFAKLPEYVIDLGRLSPSDPELSYTATVINPGVTPITFALLHTNDPLRKKINVIFDRNVKIQPGKSTKITFTLHPAEYVLGQSECLIPFAMHNGPTFTVVIKAEVREPKLEIQFRCGNPSAPDSSYACRFPVVTDRSPAPPDGKGQSKRKIKPPVIDFGTVRCGFCSVMYVQLKNTGHVVDHWEAVGRDIDFKALSKKLAPEEKKALMAERKTNAAFLLSPLAGALAVGEAVNLELRFAPDKSSVFNYMWVLRTAFSTCETVLRVRGYGLRPQLVFATNRLEFDSIFPFLGGQEKTVEVFNPTPFPLEFFCVELDKQHLVENDILSRVEEFDRQEKALFPVRMLGHGLPGELLQAYSPSTDDGTVQIPSPRPLTARDDLSTVDSLSIREDRTGKPRLLTESDAPDYLKEHFPRQTTVTEMLKRYSTKREMYRELQQAIKTPLDRANARYHGDGGNVDSRKEQFKKGVAFLIHGPPACGKTALAISLSKYYRTPILTIDQLIIQAVEKSSEPIHHKILNNIMNPAVASQQSHPGVARSVQTPPGSGSVKSRDAKPRPPATAKAQSKPPKPAVHNKAQLLLVDQMALREKSDPELAFQGKTLRYKNYLTDEDTDLTTCVLPDELLVQLLKNRLYQQDCRRGVVFDGMYSDFTESPQSTAKIILTALDARKRIFSVVLCNSFRDYCKRNQRQRTKQTDGTYAHFIREMARVRNLSEKEYSFLPPAARRKVDTTVQQYSDAMREMNRRTKARALAKAQAVVPPPEVPPKDINLSTKAQRAAAAAAVSNHKMPVVQEDHGHGLDSKSVASRSTTDTTGSAAKNIPRNQTAKHSVLKLKGKSAASAKENQRDGQNGKLRDCWHMSLKPQADGQPSLVYKTDIFKRHKLFFSSLKDYTSVITKWTAAGKMEVLKKHNRLDSSKETQQTVAKKKIGKLKDGKSRPKERTEAEKAERDRAAIERVKARCKRRRTFGVKHCVILRKNTERNDNRLVSFDKSFQRWWRLPDYETVEKATQPKFPIPKSALYTVRTRPSAARNGDEPFMSQFQFVAAPDEMPQPAVPFPMLSIQVSKQHMKNSEKTSPDRASSAGKESAGQNSAELRGSKLGTGLKSDRTKIAKSARTRPIGSAVTRDGHHSTNDSKTTTPTDPSLVYPSFSKAKALSEPKNRPIISFRWAVQAYGKVLIRLMLQSEKEGIFSSRFQFQIVDFPEGKYALEAKGVCKYPDLMEDLTKVFPKEIWVDQITDERTAPVYVAADRVLYFGPLLVGKKKADVLAERAPLSHYYSFTLQNTWKRTLNVHFSIPKRQGALPKDKITTPDYTVIPDRITLQYGEKQSVKFYAHPTVQGKCDDNLYVFTEFNPRPTHLVLSCLSLRPQAEVITKYVIIEKVPIRETAVGNLEVRNKTALLPIKWRLIGTETLPQEFVFEQREGLLKAVPEVQYIPIKFASASEKPVVHSKKPFRIEFSTEDPDLGITHVENLMVSGESYDLMLEITFPKLQDSVLDFGLCKVGEEVVRQITIKNRSKSDCGFHFFSAFEDLAKRFPNKDFKNLLEIQPASGMLTSADRPLTITITCRPKFESEIKMEKVVKCLVLDPARAYQRVAEIPIKTSMNASYAKINLAPAVGDLRFFCSLPMQKRTRAVALQNIGPFEFTYAIRKISSQSSGVTRSASPTVLKSKLGDAHTPITGAKSPIVAKPSTTSTHSSRKQDALGGLAGLLSGPFTVKPPGGTVKVNETAQIIIEFGSDAVGNYSETYVIEISDRDPSVYPNGIIYTFSGEIAIPGIDVKNLEMVFAEHMVSPVDSLPVNDPVLSKWLIDRSVYFPKRKQLVIQHTYAGTRRRLRFRLTNPTNATCPISFGLRPVTGQVPKGAKVPVDGFTISSEVPTSVEPYQTVHASVLFTPVIAVRYQAIFDVFIETMFQQNIRSTALSFEIIGEAILPNIRILQPTFRDRRKQLSLVFPKILIGQKAVLPVTVLNDSPLPVNIKVVSRINDGVFVVIQEDIGAGDASYSICMEPRSERSFAVQFAPEKTGKLRKYIDVICTDIPCPDLSILLKGEGLLGDVQLEGLSEISYAARMRLLGVMSAQYEDIVMDRCQLYFGDQKALQTMAGQFELANHTGDWLRYEWPKLEDFLEVTPRIGHVRPQSRVPVVVTYKTPEDARTQILPVTCALLGITVPDDYDIADVWNSTKVRPQLNVDPTQRRGLNSENMSTAPSVDKMAGERDSEHSLREHKHSKDHKKDGTENGKKAKEKKAAKKDSVLEKHRKPTVDKPAENVKRRESDQKKPPPSALKRDGSGSRKANKEFSAMNISGGAGKLEDGTKVLGTAGDDSHSEDVHKAMIPVLEPQCSTKPIAQKSLSLIVSCTVGMPKFECSHQELLFKETFALECRRVTFTVRNTGNVALVFTAEFSTTAESCFKYMEQLVTRKPSQPPDFPPEKKGKKGVTSPEDPAPATLTPNYTGKSEKGGKHGSRALSATSTTDTSPTPTPGKEQSPGGSSKKKRRVSKDTAASDLQRQQELQRQASTPLKMGKATPNVRKIEAGHFQNMGSKQSADLTSAFTVRPSTGVIFPGMTEAFTVEFRPGEPMEFFGCLFFGIENYDPPSVPLGLPIHGVAKIPVIHLSTLVEGVLKLSDESRVLEFVAIGVEDPVIQQLVLTNPTEISYEVEMVCLDENNMNKPPFELSSTKCLVAAGKRTILKATFIPYTLGKLESKWTINIPSHQLSVPITLLAQTRDADVTLNPPLLEFRPIFPKMRREKTLTLTNEEKIPLKFEFILENFKGHTDATWTVHPATGVLPAQSKQEITVTFAPNATFKGDIILSCKVERRSVNLRVSLDHDVTAPLAEVVYINESERQVVMEDTVLPVNPTGFGATDVCSVYKRSVQITNIGAVNVAYTTELCHQVRGKYAPAEPVYLEVSGTQGLIQPGRNHVMNIVYSPKTLKDRLTGLFLVLQIDFGQRFVMVLDSDLFSVDIDFSFDDCDYGPVLIEKDCPGTGSTVPLVIANQTRKTISVDLVHFTIPPCMAFEFLPMTLQPVNSSIHTLMFLPTEIGQFAGSLTFLINASLTKTLTIKGEGVAMVVEVSPRMRHLAINGSAVGVPCTVVLVVQNRSKSEVTGHLKIQPRTNAPSTVSQVHDLVKEKVLTFNIPVDVTIPAGGSRKFTVVMNSPVRVPQFDAKVIFVSERKVIRELATLTGFCPGLDVVLEEKIVDFSSLVFTGSQRRNIVMKNLGEVGTYFSWDKPKLHPHFTIEPVSGYAAAKNDVVLVITFSPKSLDPDIRVLDILCDVPGNRHPITLSLIGSCIPLPPAKDTVTFECAVRQTDTKLLLITNNTTSPWDLRPQFNGEHWAVATSVTVRPNSTESFEAVFKPLLMAKDGAPHQGTVSVILPTGQAVVYNLIGKTLPPKPNGRVVRDVPCRVEWKENLLVTNWLPRTQSFRVIYEYVKPDKPDPAVELNGKTLVHLPASAQTEYEFVFRALRDKDTNQVFTYRLVFKSEETGEYQYYEVQYRVTKGPPYATKTLAAVVRSSKREAVKLKNPLEMQITLLYGLQGGQGELTVDPLSPAVVPGRSETEVYLEYFPLKMGTTQARMDVGSQDLGAFSIDITLQGIAPPPEPPATFETALGTTHSQTCKLQNFARMRADFMIKILEGSPEFQLTGDRSVFSIPPGSPTAPTEQTVELLFDPSQLGDFHGRMVATSTVGGEFQFPLVGTSVRPKPRGPYTVTANGDLVPALEFKNPFNRPSAFSVSLSNRIFQVKELTEVVKPKKSVNIQVVLNTGETASMRGVGAPVFSQLTVTPKFDGAVVEEEYCEWTYFIQAEI